MSTSEPRVAAMLNTSKTSVYRAILCFIIVSLNLGRVGYPDRY